MSNEKLKKIAVHVHVHVIKVFILFSISWNGFSKEKTNRNFGNVVQITTM